MMFLWELLVFLLLPLVTSQEKLPSCPTITKTIAQPYCPTPISKPCPPQCFLLGTLFRPCECPSPIPTTTVYTACPTDCATECTSLYKTLDDCPRSTTTVLPPVSLTSTVDPPDTASSINLPPSPPEIGNGLYGPPCCKGPTHPENSTTTWPIITLTRTARPPSLPPTLIPPPCCKGTVTPKTSSTKVPSCTIPSSAYTPTITPIPTPPKSCVTVTDTAGPNCPRTTCLPADCIYLSQITQRCGCTKIFHTTSCKTRCDGACSTQYQTLYLPCPMSPPGGVATGV